MRLCAINCYRNISALTGIHNRHWIFHTRRPILRTLPEHSQPLKQLIGAICQGHGLTLRGINNGIGFLLAQGFNSGFIRCNLLPVCHNSGSRILHPLGLRIALCGDCLNGFCLSRSNVTDCLCACLLHRCGLFLPFCGNCSHSCLLSLSNGINRTLGSLSKLQSGIFYRPPVRCYCLPVSIHRFPYLFHCLVGFTYLNSVPLHLFHGCLCSRLSTLSGGLRLFCGGTGTFCCLCCFGCLLGVLGGLCNHLGDCLLVFRNCFRILLYLLGNLPGSGNLALNFTRCCFRCFLGGFGSFPCCLCPVCRCVDRLNGILEEFCIFWCVKPFRLWSALHLHGNPFNGLTGCLICQVNPCIDFIGCSCCLIFQQAIRNDYLCHAVLGGTYSGDGITCKFRQGEMDFYRCGQF